MQKDKLPDWAVGNAGEGMSVVMMVGATVSYTLVTVMITLALGSVEGLWHATSGRCWPVHSGIIGANAIIIVRPQCCLATFVIDIQGCIPGEDLGV